MKIWYNKKRVVKGKKALKLSYTYAVVDLETTSTHIERGKIIQFACVFIRGNEVVDSFSTYINPGEHIEESIQQLTGITDKMVAKAPYFEEVASVIKNMLEQCVFVAHNVSFDYPFLQRRLKECGFQPLRLKAIDTVELAQISFPTLTSYRLSDLASELVLTHKHPHRADSDALVTAELLLKIRRKLLSLPVVTLKQLRKLGTQLTLDTGWFLYHMLKRKQKSQQKWNEDIQVVSGLALRKTKSKPTRLYETPSRVKLRATQEQMVNAIQKFLASHHHNLAIEAPTGTGKTLGYLYALKDEISMRQPLIISTSTLVLQQQIMEQAIPMVDQFRKHPLRATSLKSASHYIDLARFVASLRQEDSKQARLYQMQILVWLTQTTTGDLEELNFSTFQHPYWQQIRHRGLEYLDPENPYYGMDFVRRIAKEVRRCDVIVTNHALLVEDAGHQQPLLPPTRYLVIDEAQQFSRVYQQSAELRLSPLTFTRLRKQVDQWSSKNTCPAEVEEWIALIRRGLDFYYQALKQFSADMTLCYQPQDVDQIWRDIPYFSDLTAAEKGTVSELLNTGHELLQIIQPCLVKLQETGKQLELVLTLKEIQSFLEGFNQFLTAKDDSLCREVQGQYQQIWFQVLKGMNQRLSDEKWFQRYQKVLFVGGTLLIGNSIDYFERELGLSQMEVCVIPEVFNYKQQGKLFVLTDQDDGDSWYSEQKTAQVLADLALNVRRPMMCLLTSHTSLERIYHYLEEILGKHDIEILAQNITGSKAKNLKRFLHAKNGILLGTDSFWEGIDLPGQALEILVIGKLPFLAPDMNFQKYKERWLRENGLNPFYDDSLPRAILRLRQGFGRLIRTQKDCGVMILLDRRFVDSRYAATIQQSMPKGLPLIETDAKHLSSQVMKFLKK